MNNLIKFEHSMALSSTATLSLIVYRETFSILMLFSFKCNLFVASLSILINDLSFSKCRWMCYCHVPAICDSLPRYETTLVFGRTLLRSVFQTMRKQLLDKFRAEKEKMPPEKRTLVLKHFPRYR